ncbi:MAG: intradiol ring-cleavage dioxygenase [Verrucomicrobia bacterium]|nr:intradiol ring-cleavage dioxygenase [Verrucomicrobiota bacterium]
MITILSNTRRQFLRGLTFSAAALAAPGAFAEALTRTPRMTEGPFYPDRLPLDTDNDLLIINNQTTPAIGEITHLSGRILSASGSPVRNAVVEIWQCDQHGAYIHSRSGNAANRDRNFQGYGRFLTDARGQYYFRTIKPVPYPGRTPHIHFAINRGSRRVLTTQMLIKGHPGNERDGIFRSITDPKLRAAVMTEFKPMPGSRAGELTADFDLVLDYTPEA